MNRKSPFSTTPLSFDAPSPVNPREYQRKRILVRFELEKTNLLMTDLIFLSFL